MRERAARIGGKLTVTQLSEIRSQGKLNSLPKDKGDAPSHGPITHLERFALRFPFRKPSYEHLLGPRSSNARLVLRNLRLTSCSLMLRAVLMNRRCSPQG